MQHPAAVQGQDGQQIEAVQNQGHDRRLDQQCVVHDQTRAAEEHAQHDSGHRPHQRHNGLLPAGHVVVLARNRRPKERDEEHAQIAVLERAHREVMPQFVKEQNRYQQQDNSPRPSRRPGAEKHQQ